MFFLSPPPPQKKKWARPNLYQAIFYYVNLDFSKVLKRTVALDFNTRERREVLRSRALSQGTHRTFTQKAHEVVLETFDFLWQNEDGANFEGSVTFMDCTRT